MDGVKVFVWKVRPSRWRPRFNCWAVWTPGRRALFSCEWFGRLLLVTGPRS